MEIKVSIPFIAGQWSLQHDGRRDLRDLRVSIPFIAGQWSLLEALARLRDQETKFQSPSLRGSGRFRQYAYAIPTDDLVFQSPSLRGSGRFSPWIRAFGGARQHVSIPFIAGQWSLLLEDMKAAADEAAFQSPSLRGSGRFWPPQLRWRRAPAGVSIPFIAGQWSLRAPSVVGRTRR